MTAEDRAEIVRLRSLLAAAQGRIAELERALGLPGPAADPMRQFADMREVALHNGLNGYFGT